MKRTLLMILGLCCALKGRAEILLKGIMFQNEVPTFSLYLEADQTSKWVPLGKSFAGFKVVDFDPQTEVLTLVKDESRKELKMEQSKIKDSVEDANTRLKTAQGVELAYELLRQKDRLLLGLNADQRSLLRGLEENVRAYQNMAVRVQEMELAQSLAGGQGGKASAAGDFLKRRVEELRVQLEKSASELSMAARALPANAVNTSAASLEAERLAFEREKTLKAGAGGKAAEEKIEKQIREMRARPPVTQ